MENCLPVEIITSVLSRLLTETLLECSLVCKTWRNIIYNNDKLFAHMHSRLIYDHDSVEAVTSGKASFVYLDDSVEGPKHLKYMEYDDDNEKPLKFGIANLIPALGFNPVWIVGSCNGLICISGSSEEGESSICICNPITREFVYLPSEPIDYVVSGFGYTALTNEYKVVGIYWEEESLVGRVYVYTLGSGNGWRNLDDISYDYELHPSLLSNEILVNGALHWLDEDGDIVKFDLSDETFSVIERSECIDISWKWGSPWDFELRVLGGCLRIIHRHGSKWYSIWSFKKNLHDKEKNGKLDAEEEDYESSWSWEEKALELGELYYNKDIMSVYPFAILKDNTKILYHTAKCIYDNKWYYYRQDFGGPHKLKKIADDHPPHDPVRYVKSFVSLKALGEGGKIMKSSEGGTKV